MTVTSYDTNAVQKNVTVVGTKDGLQIIIYEKKRRKLNETSKSARSAMPTHIAQNSNKHVQYNTIQEHTDNESVRYLLTLQQYVATTRVLTRTT